MITVFNCRSCYQNYHKIGLTFTAILEEKIPMLKEL